MVHLGFREMQQQHIHSTAMIAESRKASAACKTGQKGHGTATAATGHDWCHAAVHASTALWHQTRHQH